MRGKWWPLLILLAAEVLLFSLLSPGFLSGPNVIDLIRNSSELGLIALAMTCVIVSGGIDLSAGSLLGLSAILFGLLAKSAGLPVGVAVVVTLLAGVLAGMLNGVLIARFRLLPLIVTLATLSLFRGLAEGVTGGAANFTDFDKGFLFLGQGLLFGFLPAQAVVLAVAVGGFYVLLHRSVWGRVLSAHGYSAPATYTSGIAVPRYLTATYALAGFCSALAGILYVARVGQAKSDAGTGYELLAITAVVLGGTSILGGSGSIVRTLLGLAVIAVLQNGLRLAGLPVELAGLLTGLILVGVLAMEQMQARKVPRWAFALVGLLLFALGGMAVTGRSSSAQLVVAMMPKEKGDPYFISCRRGAEEAAKELGVQLLWDGPADLDPARQNEIVESWITRKVDVIAVSVENRAGLSTALRKARAAGIPVITWDADAEPDARDYFINQATAQGIGYTLTDETAAALGGKGSFAIVTASLTAANQNEWIRHVRERLAAKYPEIKLETIRPSDGDRDRAFSETQTILRVFPQVRAVMGVAAPAVPGAAEAVKQSGRSDVAVTGLSLPSLCKPYVHGGIIKAVVLWNTGDLGYLTVRAATALKRGQLKQGVAQIDGGRLGKIEIQGDQVMLGKPYVFNQSNIDNFDF